MAKNTVEERGYFFLEHEDKCPRNKEIRVPTCPGSEKLFAMKVCDECEPYWHEYRYSSAAAFFE